MRAGTDLRGEPVSVMGEGASELCTRLGHCSDGLDNEHGRATSGALPQQLSTSLQQRCARLTLFILTAVSINVSKWPAPTVCCPLEAAELCRRQMHILQRETQ